MRIIGGQFKGLRLNPPKDLPVRPTTDMAKEALFNIIPNLIDIEGCAALDLFTGTGGIAIELASRGAKQVDAIDLSMKCVNYLQDQRKRLNLTQLKVVKSSVFQFLDRCTSQYDFIFADPPYDLDRLMELPSIILAKGLLKKDGVFVLEFPSQRALPTDPIPTDIRKYGNSSFAFYQF